ncbi:MAG: GHKL domain-containing protein [Bacteroidales bacterium]|nr:GHKL domain-containing protein [Bacteroidales bacterium]
MNKRKIQIVIAFSFIALLGIIGIQYYWISKIYEQNHLLFDQNIHSALKYAVKSMEKEEHLQLVGDFNNFDVHYDDEKAEDIERRILLKQKNHDNHIRKNQFYKLKALDSLNEKIIFVNQQNDSDFNIVLENINTVLLKSDDHIKTTVHITLSNDSIIHHFENKADSLIQILEYRTIDLKTEQLELEATVNQLVWEMDEWTRPFSDHIPLEVLENVLEKTRIEYQLPIEYDFAVIDHLNDDSLIAFSEEYSLNKHQFTYFTNISPDELLSRNQILSLQFNNNPLLIKLSGPILISLSFTMILLLGFILIIKNLLHHRKVSEMKSDFINNMTHEFKTPIATISLASDSILNPTVLQNQEKVGYFTGMIKKENKRMNRLVEKILQMARLENKELELDRTKVNVHELLEIILENTHVKLNGDGKIKFDLGASNFWVKADQDHLTNVIYNLLDNAIKYSDKEINIEVKTYNHRSQFCLLVTDQGKGMDKKEIQYIFDRFYRIESGNVHNVKGYGLGLTYVKAIIEKHQGQVLVKSEVGKGSSFEIRLPFDK